MSESANTLEKLDYLRERLAKVCVSARDDLSVSRHIFRGKPSYIVHDPISMNSHRFSKYDYQMLAALTRSENLGSTFQRLVDQQHLTANDEIAFFEFVLLLQTQGLLDLPITDSKQLYDRHCKIEAMKSRNLVARLMFLKIPLFNPNDFLNRTVNLAKPLFSKPFFVFWILLTISSLSILVYRRNDFFLPLADLLATRNLPIFIFVVTALKFWHELGHAYACKIRGGVVPDMGAFFMVGMPMAYVDVSSSWSFPARNYRILVGLGGMYFESIAASIATIIWALSPTGLVNSTAHFTVLMAGFMTLFFNANPLMRYDGYYILSDLLGIPNLRQRSTNHLKNQFKKIGLGIPNVSSDTKFEKTILTIYGVLAVLYQVVLVLSISLMLASQYFIVGVGIAAAFTFTSIVLPVLKFLRYLFIGKETQQVRGRSRSLGLGISVAAIAVLFVVPTPGSTVIQGELSFENIQVIRMPVSCQIRKVLVEPNQFVKQGQAVVSLTNSSLTDQFRLASASVYHASTAMSATTESTPISRKQSFFELDKKKQELATAKSYFAQLSATSEFDGRVLSCPSSTDIGKYRDVGEEILRIGSGKRVVRALLNEEQLTSSQPTIGQTVNVRLFNDGATNRLATITRIEPAGSKKIEMIGLTHMANGNIIVDPTNGEASQPYFLIELSLHSSLDSSVPEKMTANIQLGKRNESFGFYLTRRFIVLTHQLSSGT